MLNKENEFNWGENITQVASLYKSQEMETSVFHSLPQWDFDKAK